MMIENPLYNSILEECVKLWFKEFHGIHGTTISEIFNLSNQEVMDIFIYFQNNNFGRLNENVHLYSINPFEHNPNFSATEIITHIFFPSKNILKEFFYKSNLPQQIISEYTKRLYLGGSQIEFVYFNIEVLSLYFNHPEKYVIEDTLSGGYIYNKSNMDNDDDYINIKDYGKCKINDNDSAIVVILYDLSEMSLKHQRFWSSFELPSINPDFSDNSHKYFLNRIILGEFNDYINLFEEISEILNKINSICNPDNLLFKYNQNKNLAIPCTNTFKDFCDSCSELFKLIGPDNINLKSLKLLLKRLDFNDSDFINNEDKKSLSFLNILGLLESKNNDLHLTDVLHIIRDYRTNSAHIILVHEKDKEDYILKFNQLCKEIIKEYINFYNLFLK